MNYLQSLLNALTICKTGANRLSVQCNVCVCVCVYMNASNHHSHQNFVK